MSLPKTSYLDKHGLEEYTALARAEVQTELRGIAKDFGQPSDSILTNTLFGKINKVISVVVSNAAKLLEIQTSLDNEATESEIYDMFDNNVTVIPINASVIGTTATIAGSVSGTTAKIKGSVIL